MFRCGPLVQPQVTPCVPLPLRSVFTQPRDVCLSMRGAGIYKDLIEDGGRWELKQALRWAITGQVYKNGEWLQTQFGGFGFRGGQTDQVIGALLKPYAPIHWPDHGMQDIRMR